MSEQSKRVERTKTFDDVTEVVVRAMLPVDVETLVGDDDTMRIWISGPEDLVDQIDVRVHKGQLAISGPRVARRSAAVTNIINGAVRGTHVQVGEIHGGINFGAGGVTFGERHTRPASDDDWAGVRIEVRLPRPTAPRGTTPTT